MATAGPTRTEPALRTESGGGVTFWNKGPLEFNLSSTGLALSGATNSASALRTFISKLEALAALLPDREGTEAEE